TALCYWASPDVLAAVLDIDRPFSVTETFYFCLVIRTDRRYSYQKPPLTIISTCQSRSLGNSPNSGKICKEKKNEKSLKAQWTEYAECRMQILVATESYLGLSPPRAQKNAQGYSCAVFVRNLGYCMDEYE
ncbi:hypothetical protein CFAM422_004456, partial [Trichoderma lentiforme]